MKQIARIEIPHSSFLGFYLSFSQFKPNNWFTYDGFYITDPFETKMMNEKYIGISNKIRTLAAVLEMGIILKFIETNLILMKKDYMYTVQVLYISNLKLKLFTLTEYFYEGFSHILHSCT